MWSGVELGAKVRAAAAWIDDAEAKVRLGEFGVAAALATQAEDVLQHVLKGEAISEGVSEIHVGDTIQALPGKALVIDGTEYFKVGDSGDVASFKAENTTGSRFSIAGERLLASEVPYHGQVLQLGVCPDQLQLELKPMTGELVGNETGVMHYEAREADWLMLGHGVQSSDFQQKLRLNRVPSMNTAWPSVATKLGQLPCAHVLKGHNDFQANSTGVCGADLPELRTPPVTLGSLLPGSYSFCIRNTFIDVLVEIDPTSDDFHPMRLVRSCPILQHVCKEVGAPHAEGGANDPPCSVQVSQEPAASMLMATAVADAPVREAAPRQTPQPQPSLPVQQGHSDAVEEDPASANGPAVSSTATSSMTRRHVHPIACRRRLRRKKQAEGSGGAAQV